MSRRAQNRLDKERRILDAAIHVFAQSGYTSATMDAVAAQAGLTKPTLYQYFPSKDALFKAMMQAPRDAMMLTIETGDVADPVAVMLDFARRYAAVVMAPEFLSLARLIIGEAQRFPDVGRAYQASGPDRVLAGLVAFMNTQRAAGRLAFEDAELAAQDFWGLILSGPRNKALHRPDNLPDADEIARSIHNGIGVFLRAYSTDMQKDGLRLAALIAG